MKSVLPPPKEWNEEFQFLVKGVETMQDFITHSLEKYSEKPYFGNIIDGSAKYLTQKEVFEMALSVGSALLELGLKKGDCVGIYSENRLESFVLIAACHLYGFIAVVSFDPGMVSYPSFVFANSGVRALYISQVKSPKFSQLFNPPIKSVEFLLVDEPISDARIPQHVIQPLLTHERYALPKILPDDPCTIIYSSGTCGAPKGIVLTHQSMVYGALNVQASIPITSTVIHISFLPLAHILERITLFIIANGGGKVVFATNGTQQLLDDMQISHCTGGASIPAILTNFHNKIIEKFSEKPKFIFSALMKVTNFCRRLGFRSKLCDALAWDQVKSIFGGHLDWYVVAGDVFHESVAEELSNILDIRIFTIYGLSEAAGPVSCTPPRSIEHGTCGRLVPGFEAKIDTTGEILFRSTSMFKTYWKQDDVYQRAFVNGWFRTGDKGSVDKYGNLLVFGRAFETVEFEPGLELAIRFLSFTYKKPDYIEDICIIPVQEIKSLLAIIVIKRYAVTFYNENKDPGDEGIVEIMRSRGFLNTFQAWLENIYERERLKPEARLANFRCTLEPFTTQNGLLTPTGKQRVNAIKEKYAKEVEEMIKEVREKQATEQ